MPKWSKRLLAMSLRYANSETLSTEKELRLLLTLAEIAERTLAPEL